ncbi:hypothetical protein TL16_g01663 [Triparma laevis f. inornata]|uniref:Uncharacterized protein n=1 Tax=Triparma laevis f. inornata TaxID=1714386 RepID=A0A9W6ZPU4_9STRA|nr:hypothetical protein TL16_g01663 [Triparma laevis f. inornata]
MAPSPLLTALSYLTSLTVYFQYMPLYYGFSQSYRNFIRRLTKAVFYFLLPYTMIVSGGLRIGFGCGGGVGGSGGGVAAKLLGSMGILNLLGFSRLIKIEISHDVPLTDVGKVQPQLLKERTKLRVRLRWRNPKPMKNHLEYLLFDSLTTPLSKRDPSLVFRRRRAVLNPIESSNKLIRKEYEHGVETRKMGGVPDPDSPMTDRSSWIEKAALFRAEKHEDDLGSGDIKDPLGLAVQQTLGVGASFSFDYNDIDDLESDDQVVHVLRARCALSAVKRARWLFDPERANAVIEQVSEPEQNAAKARLVSEAEAELEELAAIVESMTVVGLDAPKGSAIDFMEVRQQHMSFYQPAPSSMDDVIGEIVKIEFGDVGGEEEGEEGGVVLSFSEKNLAILKAFREKKEEVVEGRGEGSDADFVKSWVDQKLGLNDDGTKRNGGDGDDDDDDVGLYIA